MPKRKTVKKSVVKPGRRTVSTSNEKPFSPQRSSVQTKPRTDWKKRYNDLKVSLEETIADLKSKLKTERDNNTSGRKSLAALHTEFNQYIRTHTVSNLVATVYFWFTVVVFVIMCALLIFKGHHG